MRHAPVAVLLALLVTVAAPALGDESEEPICDEWAL